MSINHACHFVIDLLLLALGVILLRSIKQINSTLQAKICIMNFV